jgi:ribosomal protein S3
MQEIFKKLAINSSIKGMKLLINGKLKGKSRASSVIVNHGGVANQTIITDIDFAITHIYTRLGAFGMRIWIQRK